MRKYIHTHTYTHNHGAWQLFVEILTCKLWNLKINICKNNAKTIYSSSSTGKKHHNLTYDTVSTSSSYMLQYCTFMPLTVVLIILSFPSPTLSFIPDLKPSFSANPSHYSLSFSSSGLTTWFPRGILNRQSRAERQNTFDWLHILPVRVTISQYKSYSAWKSYSVNISHILPARVTISQYKPCSAIGSHILPIEVKFRQYNHVLPI